MPTPAPTAMGVWSRLPLPPSFSAAELAVAVFVMRPLPTRLAKELITLIAVLAVEVVVRLVEVAASGVVIMVCNAPPATANLIAPLPLSHAVPVFCPHHHQTPVPVVSRHFHKFAHPSGILLLATPTRSLNAGVRVDITYSVQLWQYWSGHPIQFGLLQPPRYT